VPRCYTSGDCKDYQGAGVRLNRRWRLALLFLGFTRPRSSQDPLDLHGAQLCQGSTSTRSASLRLTSAAARSAATSPPETFRAWRGADVGADTVHVEELGAAMRK
jgi:hypothetical protein